MQLILRLFYILATLLQLSHRALDKLQLPSTSTTGGPRRGSPKSSRVESSEQCKRLACHSVPGMKQLTVQAGRRVERGAVRWVTSNNRHYILQTLRHFQQFVVFYYLILNCLGCHTNTQRGPLVLPELPRCRLPTAACCQPLATSHQQFVSN